MERVLLDRWLFLHSVAEIGAGCGALWPYSERRVGLRSWPDEVCIEQCPGRSVRSKRVGHLQSAHEENVVYGRDTAARISAEDLAAPSCIARTLAADGQAHSSLVGQRELRSLPADVSAGTATSLHLLAVCCIALLDGE